MLGVTVFALLEVSKKSGQRQTTFLLGLLVLLLIHIAGELYIYSGAYQFAPAIAGATFPIRVLLGPALYFYACSTMSPEKISKRAYTIALVGPLIVVLAMLPFVFGITPEEKLALADPATRDPELWRIALFTCLFATFVFILFTGGFLAASLRVHIRHRQQLMERFSVIDKRSFDWLRTALMLWGAAWFLYAIEFALGAVGLYWFGSGVVLPLLEAFVLMVFIQRALNQPTLEDSDKGLPFSSHVRAATLSSEKMALIAKQFEFAMNKKQLFLQDNLSLKRLAESIEVSENNISETLSQHLNTNFFHFINGFRIEEAKKRLRDKDKLVSTIAFEVGFNSKSTFNTAFKKLVGTTPSAYRNKTYSLNS
jgi:AraC-like DNA-binding protein